MPTAFLDMRGTLPCTLTSDNILLWEARNWPSTSLSSVTGLAPH